MPDWRNFLVRPTQSLVEAARVIDSMGGQIAIVTDDDGRLLGTVTDADLRKALLNGGDFQAPCSQFMSSNPISLPAGSSREECRKVLTTRHIGQLPLIDPQERVVDVLLMTELYLPEKQSNAVVIMAGGLGTRLAELTVYKPKPLLDVGGRPLLETIIGLVAEQGFSNIYLSVNYKAAMIMDHFGDGSKLGLDIRYLKETKRLGTAGALHLLPPEITEDFIVMNGDVLSNVELRRLLLFHRRAGGMATMAVKDYEMTVPYGVVNIGDDNQIFELAEKPVQRFFINAGIYALSPTSLKLVPKDQFFDMPSLFKACAQEQHKTSAYPLREYWIDIGRMQDFDRANDDFSKHFRIQ